MTTTYGPPHRWFAWHPVDTEDRGWRWLRFVTRKRVWDDASGLPVGAMRYWVYAVKPGER
jgi:hypothetical protein